MRIGIDIMGGDFAPDVVVKGAVESLPHLSAGHRIVLIGDKDAALRILAKENADPAHFDFVHTTEVIQMGDNPYKSFSKLSDSSIVVGFKLLKTKQIDVFGSAGNTGAMMVGAMTVIKALKGVIRPTIAALIPRSEGKYSLVLDVGLNPDAKPDVLYQYGIFGKVYAENVLNYQNPRVALLNIGSEPEKGSLVVKAAYELMENNKDFNFFGNVEGSDFFKESLPEVIVTDGFVGNILLKQAEAFYSLVKSRNIEDPFFEQFNFEHVGGTPVLGIDGNVLIAHGISRELAIKNLILQSVNVVNANLPEKFAALFNEEK